MRSADPVIENIQWLVSSILLLGCSIILRAMIVYGKVNRMTKTAA